MPELRDLESRRNSSNEKNPTVTANSFQALSNQGEPSIESLIATLESGTDIDPGSLAAVFTSFLETKNSVASLKSKLERVESENSELSNIVKVHEGRIDHLEKSNDQLKDEITDLKAKMMANNIILLNIPETDPEEVTTVVSDFFRNNLQITKNIPINITHRYGKKPDLKSAKKATQNGENPDDDAEVKHRPIVVSFVHRSDKQLVMSRGPRLKKTKFRMVEQRPAEIRTAQSLLFEKKKQMEETNPELKEKIKVKGTRLMVDGKEKYDTLKVKNNCLDKDFNTTTEARKLRPKSGIETTADGSVFRAHYVPLELSGQVNAALASVYSHADGKFGKATHNSWALRLDAEDTEGLDDDGEMGASGEIMKIMKANNITSGMCIVSRFYGGRHIGPQRFDIIRRLTTDVIKFL